MNEWADKNRYLSPESASEPGKWHTSRTPYLLQPMADLTDPKVRFVVLMCSSQVGKTETGLNWLGYTIHYDPVPMLVVQPNMDEARSFSKIRLAPMLRDSPVLRGKVSDSRGKKNSDGVQSNETTHKTFPGGHLTIVGSNSPSGLASKPICRVYIDEIDRFEQGAGDEGDQVQLVKRRTETFWNSVILITSTPGIKGLSKIEHHYIRSTQKRYFLPCPECKHKQILRFGNLKWDKDEAGDPIFETVHFECESPTCRARITDDKKHEMLENGEWRITNPLGEFPGYHIWAGYSPWVPWEKIAREFVGATRGGEESLKTFVNTVLGETWEEKGEAPEWNVLQQRADMYNPGQVPTDVVFLTAGADVQADRVEVHVWGWGPYEECYMIHHEVIYGDMEADAFFQELDNYLLHKTFVQTQTGKQLNITLTAMDSGHKTQAVYRYTRTRSSVRAIKGASSPTAARVGRPTNQDINYRGEVIKKGVKLWQIGTHVLKAALYGRLRLPQPGPRFIHFSQDLPDEWFRQLTAERLVTRHDKNHQPRQDWVKIRERNEALDTFVYAYSAALMLGMERIPWDKMAPSIGTMPIEHPVPESSTLPPVKKLITVPQPEPGQQRPVVTNHQAMPQRRFARGGRMSQLLRG